MHIIKKCTQSHAGSPTGLGPVSLLIGKIEYCINTTGSTRVRPEYSSRMISMIRYISLLVGLWSARLCDLTVNRYHSIWNQYLIRMVGSSWCDTSRGLYIWVICKEHRSRVRRHATICRLFYLLLVTVLLHKISIFIHLQEEREFNWIIACLPTSNYIWSKQFRLETKPGSP